MRSDPWRNLAAGAAVLALGLAGCGPSYDRTTFTNVSFAPAPEALQERGIQITHGTSVRALLTPTNDDGKPTELDSDDDLDVQPEGANVRIERGPDGREFVFSGAHPGTGAAIVSIRGRAVDRIPVTVLPQ